MAKRYFSSKALYPPTSMKAIWEELWQGESNYHFWNFKFFASFTTSDNNNSNNNNNHNNSDKQLRPIKILMRLDVSYLCFCVLIQILSL